MDLISPYDALFYKYTKCKEQVALKIEQSKSTIAQKKEYEFVIWRLRQIWIWENSLNQKQVENKFVHLIKELWINFDSNGSWKITLTKDAYALDLVKEIVYCYGYGVMNLQFFFWINLLLQ